MTHSKSDIEKLPLDAKLLTCFKYRTGESALRCLTEGSLYFALPSSLNDTLEARFDHESTEDHIRILEQTFSEISRARGNQIDWKYDRRALAALTAINKEENLKFKKFCENTGIFSAGSRPDDQAMWAYYADNGRGFCFELDLTIDIVKKYRVLSSVVRYSNAPRIHNRFEDWRETFLELAAENPDLSLKQLQEITLDEPFRRRMGIKTATRALSIKHTDWEHEQEIRLIAPKAGAIPILKDMLKRVHFFRTDGPHWGDVLKKLYLHFPSVEIIHWEFHHGAITANASLRKLKAIPIVE